LQEQVPVAGDQVRRRRGVARSQVVLDRSVDLPVAGEPGGGAAVELAHLVVRRLARQLAAQQVAEQAVVAEPLPAGVERDQEHVRALDLLEQLVRAADLEHPVAQRRAEPGQDRGAHQEPAQLLGLAGEHLLEQVVRQVALLAGEARDELGAVAASLQREAGEVDAGDPALGAVQQQLELAVAESQPEAVVQQCPDPGLVEAQRLLGHLAELAPDPQPRHADGRRDPGGNGHVEATRAVLEQERDAVVDLRLADQVVVVEHQHDVRGRPRQRVDQRRQAGVLRGGRRRRQRGVDGLRDVEARPPERRGDVRPEANRVVVARVDRQPGERQPSGLGGAPLHEQRGLAGAGRRLDEGEAAMQPVPQALDQPRPRDVALAQPGRLDLGRQQRQRGHVPAPS
jgi:hypothetical protein